ncbi:hypothetical protein D6C86_05946 [Aureobasidium pullulans]|nr:hypothetical protein D6C86_05946 [Aureobasidium pullulans]
MCDNARYFPRIEQNQPQEKTHLAVRVVYISADHYPSQTQLTPQLIQSCLYSMTDGCKMSLVPTLPTIPEPTTLTCIASVNEARAMRIAEILSDFRHLQHAIANIRANPSAEEYYEEGYCVLRQCAAEAQALLNQPFDCQGPEPDGDGEQEKAQLQRVMLDASIRRFKIQQIHLKASAALRWLTSRNAILGGNRPQPIHTPALQQIANTMRAL